MKPEEDEVFYSKLLNDMITFVGVLEPDGTLIFANNTPLELAGITLEDVKGKKFYDAYWWAYSREAQEQIKEDIERCARGERIVHEIQVQAADGSLVWIEFSMHPVYDEEGNIKYLIPEGRDISEKKQALEDAQQKVAYLDNMPTYMAVTDPEGRLQFTSAVTIEKFGFKLEDVLGMRFDQMPWWEYSEEIQQKMKEVYERAAKGEEFEFEVDVKMGEDLYPIKYTCEPLRDENGNIYALLHTGTRIDELRAALDDAQQKVAYLDNMPTYMAVTDPEGRLQFTSAVTIEKFGIKLEDVLGIRFDQMPWWEYSEDVQRRMKEVYERAAKGEEFEFEVDVKMGEDLYPIKYTCGPLRNEKGEIYAILHTGTRIDELRAALDDARKRAEYLNNVPTPIMVIDTDFNVQFTNRAWSNMFGITSEDAKENKCYDMVQNPDCKTERCCVKKAMVEDRTVVCETTLHDGKDMVVQYTGAPIKDTEGKIIGGIEYIADITDLKRAIEERERLSDEIMRASTPVIEVWDKVLMVPLIGRIGSERADQVLELLLDEIVKHEAEVVILDVSGIPTIDADVAQHLIKAASAAKLLGSRVIFTGMRADVTETIVSLGIDLTEVDTRRTLRDGLMEAIPRV
ncbi:MAG: PAS/PAC sensor protein [Candidatus Syntrophoarchaeum caldarius]|uniref:PAS/PAC sensor protein n=1 Tax=Candidatus Syntropharchaeum caldarium TaxID=1838285 RepID=A0A1F2PAS3_9EURY|nr:MAG: PAS/PAC sensor protein [Candidatus Syntrophoarchaeum caldarius]